MLEARAALPMAAVKDQLLAKVMESEVVVVGGETGCGKTTQVCGHHFLSFLVNSFLFYNF